jgi:putative peptidoglycan lipid II flippase
MNPTQQTRSTEQKLKESTFGATLGVLFSRFSGLFRTPILTALYGSGRLLDTYYAAFRFPNALRDLLAEGALSSAFTKSLVRVEPQGPQAVKELISQVMGVFFGISLVVYIFFIVFSVPLTQWVVGDGFSTQQTLHVSQLLNILGGYLPCMVLASLGSAYLAVIGNTFLATVSSSLSNLGIVVGAILLSPLFSWLGFKDPLLGLAFGTLLGGILQAITCLYPLWKRGVLGWPQFWWPRFSFQAEIKEIGTLLIPRTLGQGATTIGLFINTYFATHLPEGSLTAITHAQIIVLVPVGLFGVASGFASLPVFTRELAQKRFDSFSSLLWTQLKQSLKTSLGSAVLLGVLAFPVCATLFGFGKSTVQSSQVTAVAVSAYSLGLVFNTAQKPLTQALYALDKNTISLINSLVYLLLNAGLASVLWRPFGMIGLGIANGLAALGCFYTSLFVLHQQGKKLGMNLIQKQHLVVFGFLTLASILITFSGIYWNQSAPTLFEDLLGSPLTSLKMALLLGICGILASPLLYQMLPQRFKNRWSWGKKSPEP